MFGPFHIGAAAAGNSGAALALLLALLIAHALGDFALQGDFLARAKDRHADLSNLFPDQKPKGLWWNCLLAHALIHAGGVWIVTGFVTLALAELLLHFAIDFAKGEGWINFASDQLLHRLCKLAYVLLLYLQFPSWITWSPA